MLTKAQYTLEMLCLIVAHYNCFILFSNTMCHKKAMKLLLLLIKQNACNNLEIFEYINLKEDQKFSLLIKTRLCIFQNVNIIIAIKWLFSAFKYLTRNIDLL